MSDVLIVGGGFTGIVTSTFIKDKKVTLYEASKNLGGILRDYIIGDSVFFSSCQYFEEDSFWSKELKLTKDFYESVFPWLHNCEKVFGLEKKNNYGTQKYKTQKILNLNIFKLSVNKNFNSHQNKKRL